MSKSVFIIIALLVVMALVLYSFYSRRRKYTINSDGNAVIDGKNKEKFASKDGIIKNAITDFDGNSYNAVRLGKQVWLAENLRSTHDSEGNLITEYDPYGIQCFYPNGDAGNVALYGYLYSFSAAHEACPSGWHLPSDEEWEQLCESLDEDILEQYFNVPAGKYSGYGGGKYKGFYHGFGSSTYFMCGHSDLDDVDTAAEQCGSSFFIVSCTLFNVVGGYSVRYVRECDESISTIGKGMGQCSKRKGKHSAKKTQAELIPNALTDSDGNSYLALKVGGRIWMAENLRTTHDNNGNIIKINEGDAYSAPYLEFPGGDENNVSTCGYLYNWPAAKRVCPKGWHLPSVKEWEQLINYVKSQKEYGGKKKVAKALSSTTGWADPDEFFLPDNKSIDNYIGYNPSANNATGFSARPVIESGSNAFFWSATESDGINKYGHENRKEENALIYVLEYDVIEQDVYDKDSFFSVRCIRD